MSGTSYESNHGFGAYSYSTEMLSIFRQDKVVKRSIEPGMPPEELSDIISDRLIEIVKRDLKIVKSEQKEPPKKRVVK